MTRITIAILVALPFMAASSCSNGDCDVDDETVLMQFKQVIAPGSERVNAALADANAEVADADRVEAEAWTSLLDEAPQEDELVFEKYMMQDEVTPTLAPGCVDMGCTGKGKHCGGNENDCTSHGMIATGYYKTCGWDTCQTGWKVRCAKCSATATAKSVPTAKPADAASPAWVAPVAVTTVSPPPPTAPPPIVMPTDKPVYAAPVFDDQLVNQSQIALARAQGALKRLQHDLQQAQKNLTDTKANISFFDKQAKDAHKTFVSNRDAAVRYAKKRAIANATLLKATQDLNNAFWAEKGAASGAQKNLRHAKNFGARKRFFEKLIVDKEYATSLAKGRVALGKAAQHKARDDLSIAKKTAKHAKAKAKSDNKYKLGVAQGGAKIAQRTAVKHTMEQAFEESSDQRNDTNSPPYGGQNPW